MEAVDIEKQCQAINLFKILIRGLFNYSGPLSPGLLNNFFYY